MLVSDFIGFQCYRHGGSVDSLILFFNQSTNMVRNWTHGQELIMPDV
jgi:hypothetical protein